MDSELKNLRELENRIQELKSALEKERLKAEILNNMIDTANARPDVNIKKIDIPPPADTVQTQEGNPD